MRNDDLVTLSEATRVLGLKSNVLHSLDIRRREQGSAIDMPTPALEGRTVRLWSLSELLAWWPNRVDGRTARHSASLSDNA